MPNRPWKLKVQEMLQVCQDELKRTAEIGKKMLSASKTNSNLHEAYEELGMLVVQEVDRKELKWNDARALELIDKVKKCEEDLESIEGEMNKIKFQAGTENISKKAPSPTPKSETKSTSSEAEK